MKAWFWLPLACLIGFMVGAWGARDELRAFKERAKEQKAAAAKPDGFNTFARMVKIPESARRPRREGRERPVSPIAVTNTAVAKSPAAPKTGRDPAASPAMAKDTPPRRLSPEDLRARIEEAQDLWRTRVDVARAQWKSRLKLTDETEKAFDAALQEMNERLYDSVAALAGILAEKEEMTPELGLRLVGETATILSETYDRIGACAAPGQRDEIAKMQMVDFVDPGVAEPLINVQGKLNTLTLGGRKDR